MKRLMKLAVWAFACSVGLAQAGELNLSVTGYFGGALTDFPILVRLSEAGVPGFTYSDATQENVRFLSPDGKIEYPREIEQWNPDGESLIWVRLPVLVRGTNFRLVWGGDSATRAPSDVWARADGGYIGVWHMDEASGDVADATGHGLTAEPYANASTPGYDKSVAGEGPVGNSRRISEEYKQSGPRLRVANGANLKHGSRFTVSCWAKENVIQQYARLLSRKEGHKNPGWEIQDDTNSQKGTFQQYAGAGTVSATATVANKLDWHRYVFVYDHTNLSAYVDGVLTGTATVAEENVATDENLPLAIGSGATTQWSLNGWMDEVRLLKDVVTADWVKADFLTQTSASFVSIRDESLYWAGGATGGTWSAEGLIWTNGTGAVTNWIPFSRAAVADAAIAVEGTQAVAGVSLFRGASLTGGTLHLAGSAFFEGARDVTISSDLTDEEMVVEDTDAVCAEGERTLSATDWLPGKDPKAEQSEPIVLWKNRLLDRIVGFADGAPLVYSGYGTLPTKVYYFTRNTDGSVTAQFMRTLGGQGACAKIKFWQDGADIKAQIQWIRYKGDYYDGTDFETGGRGHADVDGGHSICNIRAITHKPAPGLLVDSGLQDGVAWTNWLSKTPVVWLKNVSLDELSGIGGATYYRDGSIRDGAVVCHFRPAGDEKEVQIQALTYVGGALGCVKVRFAQQGDDVTARIVYASFNWGANKDKGVDYDTLSGSAYDDVYDGTTGKTSVKDLVPILSPRPVAFNGAFDVTGRVQTVRYAGLSLGGENLTCGQPFVGDGPLDQGCRGGDDRLRIRCDAGRRSGGRFGGDLRYIVGRLRRDDVPRRHDGGADDGRTRQIPQQRGSPGSAAVRRGLSPAASRIPPDLPLTDP